MTHDDRFLSLEEAAALSGSSPDALYRRVERGQIPFRKWGRRVLFRYSELLEFLDTLPGMTPEQVRKKGGIVYE